MLKKGFSQNLIRDRNITDKMVRLANIKENDVVVEIGAGYGDLTQSIAARAGHVYAVELDKDLIPRLERFAENNGNVTIVNEDFVELSLRQFVIEDPIIVMGNIPYGITGPILFKLLHERDVLSAAFITMQAEVARRMVSEPFRRTYGSLSAVFQLLCEIKVFFTLKPSVFVPAPKVDSVFLGLKPKEDRKHVPWELPKFIRMCFRNKRKYLKYTLVRTFPESVIDDMYSVMKFPKTTRAEEVRPHQFEEVFHYLQGKGVIH